MARYAYDVNTTQKYIDVHKQFQGGLKTVDTDDSLGAVFLRDAENVSLSEFGFIEKRYGTYEKEKQEFSGKLQGYWEFMPEETLYKIYAINGNLYVNNSKERVFTLYLEEDAEYRYPDISDVFGEKGLQTVNLEWTINSGAFQATRDMNAVNINKILYIFTGTYPIYAREVGDTLKFFPFSITVPTYDEIVVVGHNLLEDNYEEIYFQDFKNLTNTGTATGTFIDNYFIKDSYFNPKYPFANNNGQLNFEFSYQFDSRITLNTAPWRELYVNSISYAPIGSTASDTFTLVDPRFYTFNKINTNTDSDKVFLNKISVTGFEKNLMVSNQTAVYVNFYASVKANTRYRFRLTNDSLYLNNVIRTDLVRPYLIGLANEDGNFTLYFDYDNTNDDYIEFQLPESYIFTGERYLRFRFQAFDGTIFNGVALEEVYVLEQADSALNTSTPIQINMRNLLAGNWDFRFNIQLRIIDDSGNIFVEKELPFIIQNIPITSEKLQDYPGVIDYPILKPIWKCNRVIEHFGKLMVWGNPDMPTALFYSFPDRPTYFPSKFFLDFTNAGNKPIQSVVSYTNVLIVQTEDSTWGVRGNSGLLDAPSPYIPFTVNPSVGTIAPKSVRPVRNQLFFLSKQGIVSLNSLYAVDEQYNIKFEDLNIRNIVPQDPDAVGIQFDNQYWLNFPNYGITLRWYIDKKSWVKDTYGNYQIGNDVFNRNGAWNRFNGVFKYQIENGQLMFITNPSRFEDGNLGVYKVGIDYSLPTDLGGIVTAKFETSYLNQNYPFHPKNYKETKMDFTIQNEYNLGREPIYQMETNEHITGSIHTIDNPALMKNHRYRLTYNFSDYELAVIDAGLFTTTVFDTTIDGGSSWAIATTDPIDAAFFNLVIESILLGEKIIEATVIDENTLEFLLNNDDIAQGTDLVITGNFTNYTGGSNLIDSTYDYLLDFRTWIISEEKTLNLDNLENYDQSKALIPIEIGAKFGDWVFGLSDFGNRVTAVKTIKLSGKGYNSKVYFEDYSKSKWTLESLGITYKMKRPRSR